MLTAIFSVDAAYNYPRMITDQLRYYMKALSFINDGTLAAREAVNVAPFTYAATPGLLRVPLIWAFRDFDDQLRAIQTVNVVLGIILATMAAYVLSWVMPKRFHWMAVGFSFATMLLNPVWVTNMLSPLADLPYAVASLGAVIVLNRIFRGTDAERSSIGLKILFVLLFVVAFGCRYTAPIILIYGWLLFRRQKKVAESRPGTRRAFIVVVALLAILVIGDLQTIVVGYLWQPWQFMLNANKVSLLLNTLALGVPSQIIPGFGLLYRAPPLELYSPDFAANPFDLGLTLFGLGISAIVVYGMWRGRRLLKPEIYYVLLPLPVLAAMIPSTARYLLSYQPFVWVFLYIGATHLAARFNLRISQRSVKIATIALVGVATVLALYIRSDRVTGGQRVTLSTFSLGESRRHAPEVATTFRSLRRFLETLPKDRSLLLGTRASTGQWKVIAGIDYYAPDSAMTAVARERDLYIATDCSTKIACGWLDYEKKRYERRLQKYGSFSTERIFETRNDYSAGVVYRVRAAD